MVINPKCLPVAQQEEQGARKIIDSIPRERMYILNALQVALYIIVNTGYVTFKKLLATVQCVLSVRESRNNFLTKSQTTTLTIVSDKIP